MGVDSHGVSHFAESRGYVGGLKAGVINPQARPHVVPSTPSTALLDGDGGLGVIVASKGMEIAIAKARAVGSGFVAVTNSRHFGMSAHYPLMAVEHDMIGGHDQLPSLRRPRGRRRNAPGHEPHRRGGAGRRGAALRPRHRHKRRRLGELGLARTRGETIPEGWAIDKEGNPTIDPLSCGKVGLLPPLGSTPV